MTSTTTPQDLRTPVTVITGFLGSGKTTLLNHILTANHGKKFAVIENEFGEVGIDDSLIKNKFFGEENILELNNGCICCHVRGDLIRILTNLLLEKQMKFDAIIIETTGLADPAPVAQTFFVDEKIKAVTKLDGIITLVDAKHILQQLDRHHDDHHEHHDEHDEHHEHKTHKSEENKEEEDEGEEVNEAEDQVAFADRILLNKTDLVTKEHLEEVKKRLRSINSQAEIIECHRSNVDVNYVMDIRAFDLKRVLIKEPDFLSQSKHHHHQAVKSVSIKIDGEISKYALSQFIDDLIAEHSSNMFRYKGILSVKGVTKKYVFQGVFTHFEGTFADEWQPNEKRENKFVFIGLELDKEALIEGFKNCMVTEELRFNIDDRVICLSNKVWVTGTVKKLWDDGYAYLVRLDSGEEVWAPEDEDHFIQPLPQQTATTTATGTDDEHHPPAKKQRTQ